jgi:hypothetical protein
MDKSEEYIRKGITVALLVFTFSIIGTAIFEISTSLHEATHAITARFLGCASVMFVQIVTGSTSFECPTENPVQNIIIGYSAPIIMAILGLVLILSGKDSPYRAVGFIFMMLSSIWSLMLNLPSDAAYVAQQGFSPVFGWLIYLTVNGVFWFYFLQEVMDIDLYKKFKEQLKL